MHLTTSAKQAQNPESYAIAQTNEGPDSQPATETSREKSVANMTNPDNPVANPDNSAGNMTNPEKTNDHGQSR
jgi:hypothetical protein